MSENVYYFLEPLAVSSRQQAFSSWGTDCWFQVSRRAKGPDGACKMLRGHENDDMDIWLHIILYDSNASHRTVNSAAFRAIFVSHLALYWQIMLVKLTSSRKGVYF